jgi:hypothetical protein
VPHPGTDRVFMLAAMLERLDRPDVVGARRALLVAQDRLAAALRRGSAPDVIEALRYAVDRAGDVLDVAQRRAAENSRTA